MPKEYPDKVITKDIFEKIKDLKNNVLIRSNQDFSMLDVFAPKHGVIMVIKKSMNLSVLIQSIVDKTDWIAIEIPALWSINIEHDLKPEVEFWNPKSNTDFKKVFKLIEEKEGFAVDTWRILTIVKRSNRTVKGKGGQDEGVSAMVMVNQDFLKAVENAGGRYRFARSVLELKKLSLFQGSSRSGNI